LNLEGNKEIVKRQFQMISNGNASGAANFYAKSSLNHGSLIARETIEKVFEDLIRLHEHFDIQEIIAEGDWVACREIVSGKHDATPLRPVGGGIYSISEPSGEPYTIQHLHMFRIKDGEIVEHWACRDDLGAARQLGLDLPKKK
jgi:predicted ester cyclase